MMSAPSLCAKQAKPKPVYAFLIIGSWLVVPLAARRLKPSPPATPKELAPTSAAQLFDQAHIYSGPCGIAVNVGQCGAEKQELARISGKGMQLPCMGYGGPQDKCTLSITNDRDHGFDKNPAECDQDTFFLWDEPSTQCNRGCPECCSPEWAPKKWKAYVKKWAPQLEEARARGMKITTPLMLSGDEHALKQRFADFFSHCQECNQPGSKYYVDVLAFNGFVVQHPPSQYPVADQIEYLKVLARALKNAYPGREVYNTNFGVLRAHTADDQITALIGDGMIDAARSHFDRVFYFAAKDYCGHADCTSNNLLGDKLRSGENAGKTLGEVLIERCFSGGEHTTDSSGDIVVSSTSSPILPATCVGYMAPKPNTDLMGELLEVRLSATADDCCTHCANNAMCEGFTWFESQCYLKADLQGTFPNTGRVTRTLDALPTPELAPNSSASAICPGYSAPEKDTDLEGDLLLAQWAATADDCCTLCSQDAKCQGFAWFSPMCYLKTNVRGTFYNSGRTSRLTSALPTPRPAPSPSPATNCGSYAAPLQDVDLRGELLAVHWAATADGCCSFCGKDSRCQGYAWFNQECYLKGNLQGTYSNPGRISRILPGLFDAPSSARCVGYSEPQQNEDVSGDFLYAKWANTADDCCSLCDKDSKCDGYAWFDSQCYLKSHVRGTFYNKGRITRIKSPSRQ